MVRINHKPYRLCQNVDFKVGNGCASDVNIDIYWRTHCCQEMPEIRRHPFSIRFPSNCHGDLGLNARLCIPFLRRP